MLLLIVLLVLACVAQRYILHHSLDYVTMNLSTSTNLVDPETPFSVYTTLRNGKRFLPVLLHVQELLPGKMNILGVEEPLSPPIHGTLYHDYSQYLSPKNTVTRTYQATLPKRGRYFFQGANIYGNDFLGIAELKISMETYMELVVVPAPVHSTSLDDALGGFLGDLSVQRYIMEDPVLTAGFREYTGREPMRAISWNQSARGRGLMVKQYDYTTEPSVTIILSVDGGDEEQIEACFSLTRTVCETLESKRIRYDFLTNATSAGALGLWSTVHEGLGAQHFNIIVEGLGRATYDCTEPLQATLFRAYQRASTQASHILILPVETAESAQYVHQLATMKGGTIQVLTPQEVTV